MELQRPETEDLHIYYCLYSGKPVFVTDCKLERLPRRKTDNSIVLDSEKHLIKCHANEGAAKLIRRHNGDVERQFRLYIEDLPVAYRCEREGRYIYVLDKAVGLFAKKPGESASDAPIPPCIVPLESDGCQIVVEIEDKGTSSGLVKVTPEAVHASILHSISHEKSSQELLKLFGKSLGCRLSQVELKKGHSTRHKKILVYKMNPHEVYERVIDALPKTSLYEAQKSFINKEDPIE